eukprot:scaffold207_cov60-Phaeocystis_antarctica.AAC.1
MLALLLKKSSPFEKSLREVPSRSPFEKSLREVPSRSPFGNVPSVRSARARLALVLPAPPRRERPCVVVDLARCASALAQPTGAPRSVTSQNHLFLLYTLDC